MSKETPDAVSGDERGEDPLEPRAADAEGRAEPNAGRLTGSARVATEDRRLAQQGSEASSEALATVPHCAKVASRRAVRLKAETGQMRGQWALEGLRDVIGEIGVGRAERKELRRL